MLYITLGINKVLLSFYGNIVCFTYEQIPEGSRYDCRHFFRVLIVDLEYLFTHKTADSIFFVVLVKFLPIVNPLMAGGNKKVTHT